MSGESYEARGTAKSGVSAYLTQLQLAREARRGGLASSSSAPTTQDPNRSIEETLRDVDLQLGPRGAPPQHTTTSRTLHSAALQAANSRRVSDNSKKMIQESLAWVNNPVASLSVNPNQTVEPNLHSAQMSYAVRRSMGVGVDESSDMSAARRRTELLQKRMRDKAAEIQRNRDASQEFKRHDAAGQPGAGGEGRGATGVKPTPSLHSIPSVHPNGNHSQSSIHSIPGAAPRQVNSLPSGNPNSNPNLAQNASIPSVPQNEHKTVGLHSHPSVLPAQTYQSHSTPPASRRLLFTEDTPEASLNAIPQDEVCTEEPVMLGGPGGSGTPNVQVSPICINRADIGVREVRGEEERKWAKLAGYLEGVKAEGRVQPFHEDMKKLVQLQAEHKVEAERAQMCELGMLLEKQLFAEKLRRVKDYATKRSKELSASYEPLHDEGIFIDAVISVIQLVRT